MAYRVSLSGESQAVLEVLKAHRIGSGVIGAPLPKSWLSYSGSHAGSWKSNVVELFTV